MSLEGGGLQRLKNIHKIQHPYGECDTTLLSDKDFVTRYRMVAKLINHFIELESNTDRLILDLGCGSGISTQLLRQEVKCCEFIGLERWQKAAKEANSKGVNVILSDIDVSDMPFKDECFDIVFSGDVIEHIYDTDHFIEEVFRILKDGGLFVLTVPNITSLFNRIAVLLGFQPFSTNVSTKFSIGHLYEEKTSKSVHSSDHIRVFTVNSLSELLKRYNFIILTRRGIGARYYSENVITKLAKVINKMLYYAPTLASSVVIIAKKRRI